MKESFDNYFLEKSEPNKSCLLALKDIILLQDENISTCWKYRMPFFCYKNKIFCYLWIDKETKEPYIGFVEGNRMDNPLLIQGNRSRMKILPINPVTDLPIIIITQLINEALDFYRKGIIKIKK